MLKVIHFHETSDSPDQIFNMIVELFEFENSSNKHADNNLKMFQELQKMPEAQRAIAKWLVDPNLFNDTLPRLTAWT